MINSKGRNVSAVFGFLNALLELIDKQNPTHIAVAFDVSGPTFRHDKFPEYKAQREETPEGIEMQFATNVLGYFWMTKYFTPFLKMASAPRIVNVASYWAGDLNIDDLECKNRHYNNDKIYRQSKQADRMLTVAFAEKLKNDGIAVNAVHPGDVNSTLSNNLGYGGHESPDQGSDTPVWASTSPELEGISGKYFEHRRETSCRFGKDREMVEKLFMICEQY